MQSIVSTNKIAGLESLIFNGIINPLTDVAYIQFTQSITLNFDPSLKTKMTIDQINNLVKASLLTCDNIFSSAIVTQYLSAVITTKTSTTRRSTTLVTSSTTKLTTIKNAVTFTNYPTSTTTTTTKTTLTSTNLSTTVNNVTLLNIRTSNPMMTTMSTSIVTVHSTTTTRNKVTCGKKSLLTAIYAKKEILIFTNRLFSNQKLPFT